MKTYFDRLLHSENSPKKWELCLWWISRAVLIATLAHALFIRKNTLMALQVTGNLIGQFVWEIFMLFPKKSFLRNIPTYFQDYLAPGLVLGSLGGAYLDLYYSVPVLDIVMHAVGGFAFTIIGYEFFSAMEKRDGFKSSAAIVVFGAFCFSAFAGNVWELFEFTADQLNGSIGDAQHWSLALAQEAAEKYGIGLPNVIAHRDIMRYALMDTMEDMICNTVGAVIGWIVLKIFPYHHKDIKVKDEQLITK